MTVQKSSDSGESQPFDEPRWVGKHWYSGVPRFDRFYRENHGDRARWKKQRLSREERELLRELDELGPAYLSPLEQRVWSALRQREQASGGFREALWGWISWIGFFSLVLTASWCGEQFQVTGNGSYQVLFLLLSALVWGIMGLCLVASVMAYCQQRRPPKSRR